MMIVPSDSTLPSPGSPLQVVSRQAATQAPVSDEWSQWKTTAIILGIIFGVTMICMVIYLLLKTLFRSMDRFIRAGIKMATARQNDQLPPVSPLDASNSVERPDHQKWLPLSQREDFHRQSNEDDSNVMDSIRFRPHLQSSDRGVPLSDRTVLIVGNTGEARFCAYPNQERKI